MGDSSHVRVPQKEVGKRSWITFSFLVTFSDGFVSVLSPFGSLFAKLLLPESFQGVFSSPGRRERESTLPMLVIQGTFLHLFCNAPLEKGYTILENFLLLLGPKWPFGIPILIRKLPQKSRSLFGVLSQEMRHTHFFSLSLFETE